MDIITYGTLREGMHNFEYYKDDIRKVKEITLKGYVMYAIADSYPACIQTGIQTDTIRCDVLEILDHQVSRSIDLLELQAGYFIDIVLLESCSPYKIYLMHEKPPHVTRKIEDGDWKKFKGVKI